VCGSRRLVRGFALRLGTTRFYLVWSGLREDAHLSLDIGRTDSSIGNVAMS
jgi:hypothetical protein